MAAVLNPGSAVMTNGAPLSPRVRTEAERESWRAGFEAGMKAGTTRVLQSTALEDMVMQIRLLNITVDALCRELEARDKTLQFYRDTMRWLGE